MKLIIRKFIAFSVCLLLFNSTLSGCESGYSQKEQINVYSMYENKLLEKCVDDFMADNPKYTVKLDIGITDGKAVTKTDAIKALYAKIMAGSGPDVLVLDGLPTDQLIKKGVLENINDIIIKTQTSNQLFKNIVNNYTKDNKTYMMPTRIRIPSIVGVGIKDVNNLDSLTKTIENNINYEGDIISLSTPKEIVNALFNFNSSNWVNNKGEIRKDDICSFLISCDKIYKAVHQNLIRRNPKYKEIVGEDSQDKEFIEFYTEKQINPTSVIGVEGDVPIIDIGSLDTFDDITFILEINRYMQSYCINTWQNNRKSIFVPKNLIGISSKGANKSQGKAFVKYLFSKKSQEIEVDNCGIPVDRQAVLELIRKHTLHGESSYTIDKQGNQFKVPFLEPSDAEKNSFIKRIDSLDKSEYINYTNLEDFKNMAIRYVEGKDTLEEALKKISGELELSQKEK